MTTPITKQNNPSEFRLSGAIKLTSNGEGAKSVKVSVVARSGDPIEYFPFGMLVHDFAGMTSKAKIPLDYEHCDPIGYLNNIDASSGELVCSGAIVIANPNIQSIVNLMTGDVPFEASIQHSLDNSCLLEFVPEGVVTNVNNKSIAGPVTVVRQWELDAVAVCKLGADDATSSEIQLSKDKETKKGFFARISKSNVMEKKTMNTNETEVSAPVAAAVEAPVEAKAVEAVVEVESTKLSKSVEAPVAVEAEKSEQVKPLAVVEVEPENGFKKFALDPRCEFKRFVAEFGAEKAGTYYADGKSFEEAYASFAKDVLSENESLKKKLAALDRGAEKPIAFSDSMKRDDAAAKPQGMQAVISRQAKKK